MLQIGNMVDTGNWDNPQRGRVYSTEGCCPSLNTVGGGGLEPKIVEETIKVKQYRIRKLTPRECGRLMGVSDDDITKMLEVNSNSQCYKQFGNSIVVDVLMAQMKQLF